MRKMVSLRSCRLRCGTSWVWGPVDSYVGDGEFEVLSTRMWEMVSLRSCRLPLLTNCCSLGADTSCLGKMIRWGYHRHYMEIKLVFEWAMFKAKWAILQLSWVWDNQYFLLLLNTAWFAGKRFEHTKGVIRSAKSKDRQYNGQKEKWQRDTKHYTES
jgi:hypothetical protein